MLAGWPSLDTQTPRLPGRRRAGSHVDSSVLRGASHLLRICRLVWSMFYLHLHFDTVGLVIVPRPSTFYAHHGNTRYPSCHVLHDSNYKKLTVAVIYVCMYVCMYVCIYIYIYKCVCMYVCIYVCMYVCIMCVYIYIYIHM